MRFHEIPVSHQPQSHAWPQLPLYVDRLLLLAKNADGLGNPTTTEGIITDRIGQTGSFQKPLDMAAHGTATAGTISTKIQKCREKIGEAYALYIHIGFESLRRGMVFLLSGDPLNTLEKAAWNAL